MADNIRGRLKQTPTDIWSVRERLALASSVMRSGDQNWMSVSRAIRPFGAPSRPPDWFSQKNCALQYSDLLEKVETPRRKRGEREVTETPGDVIVRKLTIERIDELKKKIQEEAEKYKSLKSDYELAKSGRLDGNIKEFWEKLQAEKAAADEAAAKKVLEEKAARDLAKAAAQRPKKILTPGLKFVAAPDDTEENTIDSLTDVFNNDDSNQSIGSSSIATPSQSADYRTSVPMMTSPLTTSPVTMATMFESLHKQQSKESDSTEASESTLTETDDKPDVKQEPIDAGDNDLTSMKTEDITFQDIKLSPSDEERSKLEGATEIKSPLKREKDSSNEIACNVEISHSVDVISSPDKSAVFIPITKTPPRVSVEMVDKMAAEKIGNDDEKQDCVDPLDDGEPVKSPSTLDNTTEPASPTSSTFSEQQHDKPRTPRSNRGGGRPRRGRDTRRRSTAKEIDEVKDSQEKARSEVETSDDDGSRGQFLESSDSYSMSHRHRLDASESTPNSPASISHSDTEDEKAHKIWKKSIMLVWRAAANHKCANVFLHPVTQDIAPGYHNVVFRPMDLSTIKKNIDIGVIRTTVEFQRDMMLMFTNAVMYNNSKHDVHNMAMIMYNDVMTHIEQFANTQMMVQAEPKLLRTLRRSDAHSDKEEENKKRRVSEHEVTTPSGGKVKKRK